MKNSGVAESLKRLVVVVRPLKCYSLSQWIHTPYFSVRNRIPYTHCIFLYRILSPKDTHIVFFYTESYPISYAHGIFLIHWPSCRIIALSGCSQLHKNTRCHFKIQWNSTHLINNTSFQLRQHSAKIQNILSRIHYYTMWMLILNCSTVNNLAS